ARLADVGPVKLGVRPEYLRLADANAPGAIPATVQRVQDVGTYTLLLADFEGTPLRARLGTDAASIAPGATVWLSALNPHTCFYRDEELIR
ncbi:TOBE domain-containing protein, partial [Achromobacter sp. 2789STDY5608621]